MLRDAKPMVNATASSAGSVALELQSNTRSSPFVPAGKAVATGTSTTPRTSLPMAHVGTLRFTTVCSSFAPNPSDARRADTSSAAIAAAVA